MGRGGLAAEGEWGLRSTGSMGLNATGSTGSTGSSRDRSPQFASSILEFGRTLEFFTSLACCPDLQARSSVCNAIELNELQTAPP